MTDTKPYKSNLPQRPQFQTLHRIMLPSLWTMARRIISRMGRLQQMGPQAGNRSLDSRGSRGCGWRGCVETSA